PQPGGTGELLPSCRGRPLPLCGPRGGRPRAGPRTHRHGFRRRSWCPAPRRRRGERDRAGPRHLRGVGHAGGRGHGRSGRTGAAALPGGERAAVPSTDTEVRIAGGTLMTLDSNSFAFVRDHVRAESAIVLDTGKEYLVELRLLPLAREAGAGSV